jgi:hypothetical protein
MIYEVVSQPMKTLDRQKLDVVNKTRRNIFDWCGPFTPEFILVSLNP